MIAYLLLLTIYFLTCLYFYDQKQKKDLEIAQLKNTIKSHESNLSHSLIAIALKHEAETAALRADNVRLTSEFALLKHIYTEQFQLLGDTLK